GYTAAGLAVESLLLWLERFDVTTNFTLFLFWSVVGLAIYETLVAAQSIIQGIRDEDDLILGRYVRPPGMTKQAIIVHEIRRLTLFVCTGLLVILSAATAAILLPVTTVAVRKLAATPNLSSAKDALILAIGLVASVTVTVFVARIFRHRDILLATS
ncbi:hypothetical protein KDA14_01970, partial [Candidatus Saccharibacteria bacterium]|nr:hypothetical protein [Candidatus Saccharibacteria bacterium]